MLKFDFKTTAESKRFCERICHALVQFFRVDENQAVELVNAYWSDTSDIDSDPLLFSEPAYFYAMCIGHHSVLGDGRTDWAKDNRLWPPPKGWEV